jgi:hypothetical protein
MPIWSAEEFPILAIEFLKRDITKKGIRQDPIVGSQKVSELVPVCLLQKYALGVRVWAMGCVRKLARAVASDVPGGGSTGVNFLPLDVLYLKYPLLEPQAAVLAGAEASTPLSFLVW